MPCAVDRDRPGFLQLADVAAVDLAFRTAARAGEVDVGVGASPVKLASPDADEESDEDPHPTSSAPTATTTASSGNPQNLDGIDIPSPPLIE